MRKTQFERIENPVLVDSKGLQDILQVGRSSAWRIAEQAGAVVYIGKTKRAKVSKIKAYLENVDEL